MTLSKCVCIVRITSNYAMTLPHRARVRVLRQRLCLAQGPVDPSTTRSTMPLRRLPADLSRLLPETLWHRDALAGRSSGRGQEVFRGFYRLGACWAMVAVYETWGDLYVEAYDPGTACTMTLQASAAPCEQTRA